MRVLIADRREILEVDDVRAPVVLALEQLFGLRLHAERFRIQFNAELAAGVLCQDGPRVSERDGK